MTRKNTFLAQTMIDAAAAGDLAAVQDMLGRADQDMVGLGFYADRPHPNPQECFFDGYKAGLNARRADISALFLDKMSNPEHHKQALRYAVGAGLLGHIKMFYGRDPKINWRHQMMELAGFGRLDCMKWLAQQDPTLMHDPLSYAHEARKKFQTEVVEWLVAGAKTDVAITMRRELLMRELGSKIRNEPMAELLYDFEAITLMVENGNTMVNPALQEMYERDRQRRALTEATASMGQDGRAPKM